MPSPCVGSDELRWERSQEKSSSGAVLLRGEEATYASPPDLLEPDRLELTLAERRLISLKPSSKPASFKLLLATAWRRAQRLSSAVTFFGGSEASFSTMSANSPTSAAQSSQDKETGALLEVAMGAQANPGMSSPPHASTTTLRDVFLPIFWRDAAHKQKRRQRSFDTPYKRTASHSVPMKATRCSSMLFDLMGLDGSCSRRLSGSTLASKTGIWLSGKGAAVYACSSESGVWRARTRTVCCAKLPLCLRAFSRISAKSSSPAPTASAAAKLLLDGRLPDSGAGVSEGRRTVLVPASEGLRRLQSALLVEGRLPTPASEDFLRPVL